MREIKLRRSRLSLTSTACHCIPLSWYVRVVILMAVYPFLTLYPQQGAVVHFQVDDEGIQNNASMGRATHRLESF